MVRQALEIFQKYITNSSDTNVPKGQLELEIDRPEEKDRNFHLGGRSFYFFDFDDNVVFLTTPLILFHKDTREEVALSTQDWAHQHQHVGKNGPLKDYQIDFCDRTGTFRNFRDQDFSLVEKVVGKKQVFVQDVANALGFPDFQWKGPSWSCFYHAAFNERPISVITARGHSPQTIADGINLFVENGHLPKKPNFLNIYPVSHIPVRYLLGDNDLKMTVPELKRAAIRQSVQQALDQYGHNPHHRFGMSDDDPKNLHLIFEEMKSLKTSYPEMQFFVIDTSKGQFIKHEVLHNTSTAESLGLPEINPENQLKLF